MYFTEIKQDRSTEINAILNNFNLADIFTNKPYEIFKKSLAISGSTVLNLIKNNEITNISDLDLYLNVYKLNDNDFTMIINYFTMQGYREVTNLNNKPCANCNNADTEKTVFHKTTVKHFNKLYKAQYSLITKIINAIENRNNEINEFKYFSLKNHIISIIRLFNPEINKHIDLIILKPTRRNTIQKLIMETFDYDIVKNFIIYKNDSYKIFAHNYDAIINNKAMLTNTHFKNRIMSNIHEFNNFITRYIKYSANYTIYIDKNVFTKELFIILITEFIKYANITFKFSVAKLTINTQDNSTLDKLFTVYYKSGFTFNTINLRPYIYEDNGYFINGTNNNIYDLYLKYFITKIMDRSHELYFPELEHILSNDHHEIPSTNQCSICYNSNCALVDIQCGNNHKMCRKCIISLIKSSSNPCCPYCRCELFTN